MSCACQATRPARWRPPNSRCVCRYGISGCGAGRARAPDSVGPPAGEPGRWPDAVSAAPCRAMTRAARKRATSSRPDAVQTGAAPLSLPLRASSLRVYGVCGRAQAAWEEQLKLKESGGEASLRRALIKAFGVEVFVAGCWKITWSVLVLLGETRRAPACARMSHRPWRAEVPSPSRGSAERSCSWNPRCGEASAGGPGGRPGILTRRVRDPPPPYRAPQAPFTLCARWSSSCPARPTCTTTTTSRARAWAGSWPRPSSSTRSAWAWRCSAWATPACAAASRSGQPASSPALHLGGGCRQC